MSSQAYPQYKPSGVAWLGEIPEHWVTKRIKHTTYVKGRIGWQGLKSDEFINDGPYLVTGTDFENGTVNWTTCYHVSQERYNEDPYIQLKEKDLLITKDGTIGKTAIVRNLPGKASLNSGVFVTRPVGSDYETEFLFWVLNSNVFNGFIEFTKTGTTISHLYQNVFVNFAFPVPTLNGQRFICEFLDRETARIDALIEKKQRQIELLQEKRSALISHAVNKGLDPNAKMKDSGIDWLGEIPAHWEVKRFKFVIWLQRGHDLPATEFVEGEYPVCGSNGYIGFHNQFTTKGPGVTVGRSGSVGAVNYVDGDYWAHNTALYVKEFRQSGPRFAFYLLKTLDVGYLSEGTAVGTLNRNYIHELPIGLPPISEQHTIADFLDQKANRIDALIDKVKGSINLLREYRTALISVAVTGKIDVRKEVS